MLSTPHRRLVFAAYVVAMLAALFAPVPSVPDYVPRDFDKVAHVGLFFGFALVAAWALTGTRWQRLATVLAAAVALAALTEIVQALLGYRSGDVVDFVADAAGAMVGCILAWSVEALWRRS